MVPPGVLSAELAGPFWMGRSELHRDPAAEGFPVQVGAAVDVQGVHQPEQVVDVVGQFEVGGGVGGVTVARPVVGDDVVVLGTPEMLWA